MRRSASVVLLVLVVFAAGCGSDSKKSADKSDVTVARKTTTTITAGTTATSSPSTGAGSQGVTTTSEAKFTGEGSDDFCTLAREIDKKFTDPNALNSTDSNKLKKTFDDATKALDGLAKVAPNEIKADISVVASGFHDFLDAAKAVDYDFTKLDQSKLQALQAPKFAQASDRLSQYTERVCGIANNNGSTPTTGG